MSNYYSVLNGWMIPISRVLKEWNIDFQQAAEACSLQPKAFNNQESRISAERCAQLVDYCHKKTGRNDFAIAVALQFHPGIFHALGYAMMSSESLKDALIRMARYKRVISNTCSLNIKDCGEQVHFFMDVAYYEDSKRLVLSHDCILTFLATVVQFTRETLKSNYSPLAVHFCWPKPSYDTQFIADFFNCDVIYDCANIALIFDEKTLARKLVGGNAFITQAHEKMLDDILVRVNKDDVEQAVKNKVYEMLPLGTPSQTEIASHLGMSLRNLQRRLHDRETSFRGILEDVRKKLALEYIQQHHLSFSEIGYLVGFSNIGNFNRAFKRWTGFTPGVYRKNCHALATSNNIFG